ncbi:MAG: ABC transporter permease [Chloroflexi bacterium]|nr:ABC transporter permease [Chloroflexota bacterium]
MQETISFVVGGLLVGAAYALIAIGFSLIYSVTGTINLAHGAFVGLGALVMYTLYVTLSLPLPVALVLSVAAIALVAALTERLVMRPALGRLSRMHILLLTSGLLIFFQGAALVIWGSQPYALPSFSGERPIDLSLFLLPTQGIWILGALAVVVAALWWLFYRTTFGMALRACAENPSAASLMGIPVSRMIFFAFTASGAIGALGGIMVAPIASLAFNSAARFTTEGFVAAVLGGMGNFVGAVLGGLTLGVLEQGAAGWISSLFSTTLALLVLLLMLLTRPQGILGSRRGLRADAQELPPRGGFTLPAGFHRHLLWIALPLGIVIFVLPLLVRSEGLLNSLILTGIFYLTMIGLDLLMGFAGQVSLGQAAFMAIGGYTSAILTVRFNLPPILGILGGLILALVVAAILSFVSGRLRGAYLAMATLAFGLLIESLMVGAVDITGGPSGFVGIPSFSIGGVQLDGLRSNYYLVWSIVVVAFILAANIARSGRGRALWAIQTDATAAEALGVNVVAHKMTIFLLSAGMASVAGSLYAFYFHFLSPDMVGIQTSLDLPIMLVLGGEGTLIGPLIGVGVLTFLPTLFQPLALFKPLVEGLMLVVVLLWFPGGVFGGLVDLYARLFLRFNLPPRKELRPRGEPLVERRG